MSSGAEVPEGAVEICRIEIVEYLDANGEHNVAHHRDGDASDIHVLGLLRAAELVAATDFIRDLLEGE